MAGRGVNSRGVIIAVSAAIGLLLMVWSFQEAWISATPVPDPEHYRICAKLLLISSVLAFAGTIVVLFVSEEELPESERHAFGQIGVPTFWRK
jgi:hypothetical protein